MSVTARAWGLTFAGVLVIVLYVLPGVFGAFMHHASPLNFVIYLADAMAFGMLALITMISLGRNG